MIHRRRIITVSVMDMTVQSQCHCPQNALDTCFLLMPALMTWSTVTARAVIRVSQKVCQRSVIQMITQSMIRLAIKTCQCIKQDFKSTAS
eukprot:4172304-Amphidinium_carterae.1